MSLIEEVERREEAERERRNVGREVGGERVLFVMVMMDGGVQGNVPT